jgi:hypothetical protein
MATFSLATDKIPDFGGMSKFTIILSIALMASLVILSSFAFLRTVGSMPYIFPSMSTILLKTDSDIFPFPCDIFCNNVAVTLTSSFLKFSAPSVRILSDDEACAITDGFQDQADGLWNFRY